MLCRTVADLSPFILTSLFCLLINAWPENKPWHTFLYLSASTEKWNKQIIISWIHTGIEVFRINEDSSRSCFAFHMVEDCKRGQVLNSEVNMCASKTSEPKTVLCHAGHTASRSKLWCCKHSSPTHIIFYKILYAGNPSIIGRVVWEKMRQQVIVMHENTAWKLNSTNRTPG